MIITCFRGEHGPWSGTVMTRTRRGLPTFVKDRGMAELYAREPNDTGEKGENPRILRCRLSSTNPCHLSREDDGPFLGFADIRKVLDPERYAGFLAYAHGSAEIRSWLEHTSNWEELQAEGYKTLDDVPDWDVLYAMHFAFTDDPVFQECLRHQGYDAMAYAAESEGDVCMEYRPLVPGIIQVLSARTLEGSLIKTTDTGEFPGKE